MGVATAFQELDGQLKEYAFQEKLVPVSRQFWPALSVKPPGELAKTAQGWLYHAQTLRSRIAAKLTWLEKEFAEKERIVQELDVELGQLVQSLWKPENF